MALNRFLERALSIGVVPIRQFLTTASHGKFPVEQCVGASRMSECRPIEMIFVLNGKEHGCRLET